MWLHCEKLVAVVIVLIRNLSVEPEAAGQVGSLPAVGLDVDKDSGKTQMFLVSQAIKHI